MPMEADLIRVTDAYCDAKGMSRARLSTILLKGGRTLGRIADGSTLTVRTWQSCMDWLSANWPADAVWPADVARPEVSGLPHPHSSQQRGPRSAAPQAEATQ